MRLRYLQESRPAPARSRWGAGPRLRRLQSLDGQRDWVLIDDHHLVRGQARYAFGR